MISIAPAKFDDAPLLSDLASQAFIESHGSSATPNEISAYVAKTFNVEAIRNELHDPKNIYRILFFNFQMVGYSKIVFNRSIEAQYADNLTKLERLYLLEPFHGQNLGKKLLMHNIELSKEHNQVGMWLHVWKENHRAVAFYRKMRFDIIGDYDFEISPTHSNPNHRMLLPY